VGLQAPTLVAITLCASLDPCRRLLPRSGCCLRLFNLFADLPGRLSDFLAGLLCRTFLLLAAASCHQQRTHDQGSADARTVIPAPMLQA